MIARDPEAAVYRQLAAIIRDRITAGQYVTGQPIPSEAALAKEFGIARDTVRRATAVLRAEGWIVVTPGRITRVAERAGEKEPMKVPRGATVNGRPASPSEQVEFGIGEAVWVFVMEFGGKTAIYPEDRYFLTFA